MVPTVETCISKQFHESFVDQDSLRFVVTVLGFILGDYSTQGNRPKGDRVIQIGGIDIHLEMEYYIVQVMLIFEQAYSNCL